MVLLASVMVVLHSVVPHHHGDGVSDGARQHSVFHAQSGHGGYGASCESLALSSLSAEEYVLVSTDQRCGSGCAHGGVLCGLTLDFVHNSPGGSYSSDDDLNEHHAPFLFTLGEGFGATADLLGGAGHVLCDCGHDFISSHLSNLVLAHDVIRRGPPVIA